LSTPLEQTFAVPPLTLALSRKGEGRYPEGGGRLSNKLNKIFWILNHTIGTGPE